MTDAPKNSLKFEVGDVSRTCLGMIPIMAGEKDQPFSLFEDKMAIKIKNSLESANFDFETYRNNSMGLSGKAPWLVTVRAWYCDNLIRTFLSQNPNGLIVEFGGGMDARYFRVTEMGKKFDKSRWLMLDLDGIVDLRKSVYDEVLKNESENFANLEVKKCSVADVPKWSGMINELLKTEKRPILFTDMACLTYIEPDSVNTIFSKVSTYPGAWILFNTLHKSFLKTAGGNNDEHSCKSNWKWLVDEKHGENPLQYLDDKINFRNEFCVLEKCYELRKLRSESVEEFEEWKSAASEVYPEIVKHGQYFDPSVADLGYNLHWVIFD